VLGAYRSAKSLAARFYIAGSKRCFGASLFARLKANNGDARMPDLTFADFVKLYGLPPNVTVRRFKELAGIGHTRFYELAKEGEIRLLKNGRSTSVRGSLDARAA
jgi:hypothetical protein